MEIKVLAPAKINLTLDVVGRRPDGYHDIATIMQAVNLYDTVTLYDNDSGEVTVSCDYAGVPCDETNICVKAAHKFFEYCKMDVKGVHINIDKKIPTEAGLAGGSSDGAAVIYGLNQLFNTSLAEDDFHAIAGKVGADVPFCLVGGTKFATGIGTSLKKLPDFHCDSIVICKPDNVSVSTAIAYKKVDDLNRPHPLYTDEMIKALYSRDVFQISATLFNDFEIALKLPEVNEIKKIMLEAKAEGAGMTGSGSAVFGIFTSERKAKKCYDLLKKTYKNTFICNPIKDGCKID